MNVPLNYASLSTVALWAQRHFQNEAGWESQSSVSSNKTWSAEQIKLRLGSKITTRCILKSQVLQSSPSIETRMFYCRTRCVCGRMTVTFQEVDRRSAAASAAATCLRVCERASASVCERDTRGQCSHRFLQSNCLQLITYFDVGTESLWSNCGILVVWVTKSKWNSSKYLLNSLNP